MKRRSNADWEMSTFKRIPAALAAAYRAFMAVVQGGGGPGVEAKTQGGGGPGVEK